MKKTSLVLAMVLGLFVIMMFSSFVMAEENEVAKCVQLPVACTRNSDCTCSGCCSSWNVCQPTCHSEPIQEIVLNYIKQIQAKTYTCLCTKCNYSWVSTSPPTKCPNCGNVGITYSENSSENMNKEEFVALNTDIVLSFDCIEQGLQCTLNGTPCCAPYNCKGKFPNTYCQ
jgi:hypothetical protein